MTNEVKNEKDATTPSSEPTTKKDGEEVIPSGGEDWSLNIEDEPSDGEGCPKKAFWWNKTYSISIWDTNLKSLPTHKSPPEELMRVNDKMVWRAFIEYQISAVYKLCPICKMPEQNVDLKVCCYCASTVHVECSVAAGAENVAWKPANEGLEKHLRICFECEDVKNRPPVNFVKEPDNARRACIRALASAAEYPASVVKQLKAIRLRCDELYGDDGSNSHAVPKEHNDEIMKEVRTLVASYFQPGRSMQRVIKRPIDSKCGGIGVVAKERIPRFTIIGVYPGYEDPLSGEQAKLGRPGPRYSLVDLNCANYHNDVFTELDYTITPFINEPNPHESSNVAWIQETVRPEGRLSVMSVRDIEEGEELLIGYGPLYPRTYPYAYDAYAYHLVEGHNDPPCFALWHWTSLDEKDAHFVCYAGYDAESDTYTYWETEEEATARKGKGSKKLAEEEE